MEDRAVSNGLMIEKLNWEYWLLKSESYKAFCSTKMGEIPMGKDLQMLRTNYGQYLRVPFLHQKVIHWAFKDPRGHRFFVKDFKAKIINKDTRPWQI